MDSGFPSNFWQQQVLPVPLRSRTNTAGPSIATASRLPRSSTSTVMSMSPPPAPQDELTSTVFDAIQNLLPTRKAGFLLDTALALIEAGQYGPQVENYLDVYLRTPNLTKEDMGRALLARANARKAGGEKLLAQAQQDYQTVLNLDPSNSEVQHRLRRDKLTPKFISTTPASQRAPAEIWERIASHIPRYHLRNWLFVSPFHREIAVRIIFHTLDLYFGEDQENLNRGLDIFDRAKNDSVFAKRVKSLRLHWAYEEGDMLDLMMRIFRTALPEFKALQDFEWIGYPEMRADMVQAVLKSHPHLHGLGLIGWHFDAIGISSFTSLRKFTLRAEDDDGFAPMSEIPQLLNINFPTLKHLVLSAYLARPHSWDMAFMSNTIGRLTQLDLVDTRISHYVLGRILGAAGELRGLTLHGMFEEPDKASVLFGSDQIVFGADGEERHTFLPHLNSFRFLMVGEDEPTLYSSVIHFLQKRPKLRRLDLGSCPWELVLRLLRDEADLELGLSTMDDNVNAESQVPPLIGTMSSTTSDLDTPDPGSLPVASTSTSTNTSFGASASFNFRLGLGPRRRAGKEKAGEYVGLKGLRVLGVRIGNLTEVKVRELVKLLPREMIAIGLGASVCDRAMHTYAPFFAPFHQLSFLHLQSSSSYRPKPNLMSEKDFQLQTELWHASARSVACVLPSLDFIGWHREHYVVVRSTPASANPNPNSTPNFVGCSPPISRPTCLSIVKTAPLNVDLLVPMFPDAECVDRLVELKELPARRRLDCGKGVDLGTEDAAWLERKDVPMDYEVPGLE